MERSLLQRIFSTVRSGASTGARKQRALLVGTAILFSAALAGCNTASTLNPSETLTEGYVLDQQALDSVPVGSSREQVLLALGTPSTTATFDNEVFYYISQKRHRMAQFMKPKLVDRQILAIYFDKDGKVQNIANYGMQDGKLFDFVSRTTPTGGKDQTFLGQVIQGVSKAPTSVPGAGAGGPGGS
ncbi:outer membrane protein assembly factor BamE [Brucella sp. NM4]|uniref:outer membrane protein assembly factor BamE n=1 Tax=Brucella/Ochrobactrum group TaxID=2826938 RepID=UPI0024BC094F|nr:outer membrane protein assembly factor BamE [Brucella sp. NM4]WHS30789.1 outer membrane protein assembly factor BamE [Brucella sp. NM4]WHT42743.1 outer membrane protein assembly factor BamE [Ochrobactrum sp. SSR]